MVPLDRFGFAPIMKMALKLMRMTMIATTLIYEDDLDDVDDEDDADDDDDDADDDADDDDRADDEDDAQEAEGGRLETFLICAGPGSQPTLVKRLTFR